MQKFEYLENEKSFLDEIKNIFHSFWRAIIWWKIKIWWKKADASFRNLKHTDGNEFFKLEELIPKNQIKSLFNKMWQQQRARKLQAANTTEKEQCDILESAESNNLGYSMDVVGNYFTLEWFCLCLVG